MVCEEEMKISQLKIQNFRGITEFEKSFQNPLTGKPLDTIVFAGPNGSGKTSILEAIVSTLSTRKSKDDKVFTRDMGRDGKKPHVEIELSEKANVFQIVLDETSASLTETLRMSLHNRIEYFSSWREPKLRGALNVSLGKKGNRPQEVEINRLWNLKQFLINSYVADKLAEERVQDSILDIDTHGEIIKRLKDALAFFFPSADLDIKIQQVGSSLEDGFDVFFKYPNSNGAYVALDNLSSGEIEIFSFLSSVLRKDLRNGILIIDEPELHLHISWHRVIMNALRVLLPNTQIICATHSLEIMESVMSYELIILGDDIDYQMPESGDELH